MSNKQAIDVKDLPLDEQIKRAESALNYHDANCNRGKWFNLSCAVVDLLPRPIAYDMLLSWSSTSSKFDKKDFDYMFNSIKQDGGIDYRYLFKDVPPNVYLAPTEIPLSTPYEASITVDMPNQQTNPVTAKKEKVVVPSKWFKRLKPFEGNKFDYLVDKGLQNTDGTNLYEGKYTDYLKQGFFDKTQESYIAYAITTLQGEFKNLCWITTSGKKGTAKDSKLSGYCTIIGQLTTVMKAVCITESFSNAVHIHYQSKLPVLSSNGAANMQHLKDKLREAYPKLLIYLCADNDESGLAAAKKAKGNDTNCLIIIPKSGIKFYQSVKNGDDIAAVIRNAIATPAKKTPVVIPDNVKRYRLPLPRLNDKFKPISCIENIEYIFKHDKAWQGVLGFNEFTRKVTKLKKPPFDKGEIGEWLDTDDTDTSLWLSKEYDMLNIDECKVMKIAHVCALSNKYHPVKDYLNSLKWDGIERVHTFLFDSVGCNDTEYTRCISRCFFIGAVARILQAGCKVDTVLILEGKQGAFKSSLLRSLCKDSEWFSDTPFEIGSKDAFLALRGKWIVELAELDTLSRAEANAAKAFFSSQVDSFREPYGRQTIEIPRQNVFAGTVNNNTYLKDTTGNRRYLPAKCEEIDLKYVIESRDQLWAEAIQLYKQGVKWWVDFNDAVYAEVENQQNERVETDVWQPVIENWLVIKEQVTIQEILTGCLDIETKQQDQKAKNRVAHILQSLGWERTQIRDKIDNKRKWSYVKKQQ